MDILRASVRLPSDILVELGDLTGHHWNSWELEPIICDAIRAYMNPPKPGNYEPMAADADAGYQWKQVFLPEGTRLRASFGREPYFAIVKGMEIKFGDLALTPSAFANLRGSGNRNAWKAVWLRFPGNEQWVLADVCRSKQKTAIARLFGAADGIETPQNIATPKPTRQAKQARQAQHAKRTTATSLAQSAKLAQPTPCEVFTSFLPSGIARHKRRKQHAAAPEPST